jgi:hypothetical protein
LSIPKIKTAIPKQRYQIGTFSVVILGDVECYDSARYRYICAAVEDGDSDPLIYISLVEEQEGDRLVVASSEQVQMLQAPSELRELTTFCEQVIPMVQKLLQLTDEIPAQLM